MTRRRVDRMLVERALDMHESGCPVAEILATTGLSQGTYYAYLHAYSDSVDWAYTNQDIPPMLTWPGSKRGELDELVPHVPSYRGKYVEPFLGGASMFFALKPHRALLSDALPELVAFYGAVKKRYRRLHGELSRLQAEFDAADDDGKRALYDRMRDVLNGKVVGDTSTEAAFYFVSKTSFSGLIRRNRRGEYNVPYGRGKAFRADDVTEVHARALVGAELRCCDFEETLMCCERDDFAFLDPPYDSEFADYAGLFGEEEHRRLATVFHGLPCKALLVVNRTPLTLSLYGDDIVGEYVREYNVNIRGRVSSSNVHLIVGHLL
ncbi:DNA adenine methylase [Slackia heliotrinireducens]|nr:DNA adenine methylase [Slackia heliotrinireducens]